MFGFIKNLFGGFFAFLGGLFGGKKSKGSESSAPKAKKSKGYYLELDDTGNIKSEAVEAKKAEPAKLALATAEPPKAQAPAPAASAPAPAPAPASSQNGKVKTVKAEPQPSQPVVASQPVAASNNGKAPAQAESTFAPKYLTPAPTSSRRRPGPSMNMFRDMARQVKTPS